MPRKPNYRFERFERERTRAAKKAARAQAKAEKKAKVGEGVIDEDHGAEDAGRATDEQPNPD